MTNSAEGKKDDPSDRKETRRGRWLRRRLQAKRASADMDQRRHVQKAVEAPSISGQRPKVTLENYKPNRKQAIFHEGGVIHRERLLKAGNQLGKTTSGGIETTYHLTGRYPDWWVGRRFDHPVRGWAGSDGFEAARDGVQRILVGEPKVRESWGSGFIPRADIVSWKLRRGTPDALDNIVVRHVSGGLSTLGFKSYDQGREKWQGETLDLVWFDEEPPIDIYWEGLTRTNATNGLVYLTLTPLKGMSEVMMLFADCPGFWPEPLQEPAKPQPMSPAA